MNLIALTTSWVEVTDDTTVSFQISKLEGSAKVLLQRSASQPTDNLGFSYTLGQGELAKALDSFGPTGSLWAKVTVGQGGILVESW